MNNGKKTFLKNKRLACSICVALLLVTSILPILNVSADKTTPSKERKMSRDGPSKIKMYFSTAGPEVLTSGGVDVDAAGYVNPIVLSGTQLYLWAKTFRTSGVWDEWNGMFFDINHVIAGEFYPDNTSNPEGTPCGRWDPSSGDYDLSDGSVGTVTFNFNFVGLGPDWPYGMIDPLRATGPVPENTRIWLVGWVTVTGPGKLIYITNQGITRMGGTIYEDLYFGAGDGAIKSCDIGTHSILFDAAIVGYDGDMNTDALVNAFDIDWFIFALTRTEEQFQMAHPTGRYWAADCNHDGIVNAFDIDPFIVLLASG
jgi:hypothetical protein